MKCNIFSIILELFVPFKLPYILIAAYATQGKDNVVRQLLNEANLTKQHSSDTLQ